LVAILTATVAAETDSDTGVDSEHQRGAVPEDVCRQAMSTVGASIVALPSLKLKSTSNPGRW